jgi:hypothetical protein
MPTSKKHPAEQFRILRKELDAGQIAPLVDLAAYVRRDLLHRREPDIALRHHTLEEAGEDTPARELPPSQRDAAWRSTTRHKRGPLGIPPGELERILSLRCVPVLLSFQSCRRSSPAVPRLQSATTSAAQPGRPPERQRHHNFRYPRTIFRILQASPATQNCVCDGRRVRRR